MKKSDKLMIRNINHNGEGYSIGCNIVIFSKDKNDFYYD